MFDFIDVLPRKVQLAIVALLVVVSLGLLTMLSSTTPATGANQVTPTVSMLPFGSNESPNAVTNALNALASSVATTLQSADRIVTSSKQLIWSAAAHSGNTLAEAGRIVRHLASSSLSFFVRGAVNATLFVVEIPMHTIGLVTDTPVVSAMIRPASSSTLPVIELGTSGSARPTVLAASHTESTPVSRPNVQWPIHGIITTRFGVPEPPYQPIHTGLDISDGRARGTTPILPFQTGRVVATIYSRSGLGNHVIIDHGAGITSVYAHLNSISVREGQDVNLQTTIGYEGTTGVSTGTHLHFEIRVNNQPVDPHKFIPGQP